VISQELWKERLYQSYVSSGQAGLDRTAAGAEALYRGREPYLRTLIRKFVPSDRQIRIVDLGAGNGASLHALKSAGYLNIRGVDISPEQIEEAHRAGIPEVTLEPIDSFLDRTESESIDVVLLFDVLEHLSRNALFTTLDQVYRVLKPGGRCIVHVPNAEGIYGMRIRYGDLTHEQAFTPRSLQQALTTIGFTAVACFEDRPTIHGAFSLIRALVWAIGTLPHRLLLTAETGRTQFILSQNLLAVAYKAANL